MRIKDTIVAYVLSMQYFTYVATFRQLKQATTEHVN